MNSFISQNELAKLGNIKQSEETIRGHLIQFIEIFKKICTTHKTAQTLGANLAENDNDNWTFESNYGSGRLVFKFDLSHSELEGKLIFQHQTLNEKYEGVWVPKLAVYFTNSMETMYFLDSSGKKQTVSLDTVNTPF
ncbi:MAG TPA: hypothetical protein DD666_03290, partial [Advenella kashmirensis]|nr:hypothetical protein [Advenella kashmirensis]